MITSVIIQGMPRTGTTLMLDLFRYISVIDQVYPENLPPEDLPMLDHNWAWKKPFYCLQTEYLAKICPATPFIFMVRDLRDCIVSWYHYPDPDKTLLMPKGYEGIDGYIRLWQDYHTWVADNAYKYGMTISLENLIQDKFFTVRSVLKWLHIPFEQSAIAFVDNYISNKPVTDYPHRNWVSPEKKVGGWQNHMDLIYKHRKVLKECIPNFAI